MDFGYFDIPNAWLYAGIGVVALNEVGIYVVKRFKRVGLAREVFDDGKLNERPNFWNIGKLDPNYEVTMRKFIENYIAREQESKQSTTH